MLSLHDHAPRSDIAQTVTKPSCAGAAHCISQARQRTSSVPPSPPRVPQASAPDITSRPSLSPLFQKPRPMCIVVEDAETCQRSWSGRTKPRCGLAWQTRPLPTHPGTHVDDHIPVTLTTHHHIMLCMAVAQAQAARCATHKRRFKTVFWLLTERADARRRAIRPGHSLKRLHPLRDAGCAWVAVTRASATRPGAPASRVRTEPVVVAHGVAERPGWQAVSDRHGLPRQAGEVEDVQRLHLRAACARDTRPLTLQLLPRLQHMPVHTCGCHFPCAPRRRRYD